MVVRLSSTGKFSLLTNPQERKVESSDITSVCRAPTFLTCLQSTRFFYFVHQTHAILYENVILAMREGTKPRIAIAVR
jgi:hypothetical protein